MFVNLVEPSVLFKMSEWAKTYLFVNILNADFIGKNQQIFLVEIRFPQGNNQYRRSVYVSISTVESVLKKVLKISGIVEITFEFNEIFKRGFKGQYWFARILQSKILVFYSVKN